MIISAQEKLVRSYQSNDERFDVYSYSEPEKIRVEHLDLQLRVLFEKRTLEGIAALQVARKADNPAAPLVLDTRDLTIHRVEAASVDGTYKDTKYEIGPSDSILGAALTIHLPHDVSQVRITYSTDPNASALQWLDPVQTAGKKYPFLYTQSQPIHARSWIPLQDTPSVRLTYSAHVRTPEGLLAVMSAGNNADNVRGQTQHFRINQPIPSYLIALAVGDLDFAPTGERTGVFAERQVVSSAAYEFSDGEEMLKAAEQLYGPYLWGRFDILVLPPSFPYGGMENPGLIFVTPTVIAGDKSMASVIAHELSHAWSGNLVTNATWRDFWLNEGFTTYIEYRIQEHIYGERRAQIEEALAQQRLNEEMGKLKPREQVLHINLEGRDPDAGITPVPYVKGALFLKHLEHVFGRERFDRYMKQYFEHFAFQSITTEEAMRYLRENLLNKYPELACRVPVEEWISEPGLPESAPRAVSSRLDKIKKQAEDWQKHEITLDKLNTGQWSAHEWLYFLRSLPSELSAAGMKELDEAFRFTQATNSEILQQWLLMAVRCQYIPAYPRLEEFLATVGRIIFIKPLYEELVKTEREKRMAQAIYARVRGLYHPIARKAIDKIVGQTGS